MSSTRPNVNPFAKSTVPSVDDLLSQASSLLSQAVGLAAKGTSFATQEVVLRDQLCQMGKRVTEGLLAEHADDAPLQVLIDGVPHQRGPMGSARVGSPFGLLSIRRHLYQSMQDPEAPRIGLLDKRCGLLDGLTPRMADILLRFEAAVPSREGHPLMSAAGLEPPSRAGCERKAGQLGHALAEHLQGALLTIREQTGLPEGAASITLGIDRVSVPYAENNPESPLSEQARLYRTKVPYVRTAPPLFEVAWRMDFVGNVSVRDKVGELIWSARYGLGHARDPKVLAREMVRDLVWALGLCPTLKVGVCQDGARELWPLLDAALGEAEELKDVEVHKVVDFHHFWPRVARLKSHFRWTKAKIEQPQKIVIDEKDVMINIHKDVFDGLDKVGGNAGQKIINKFLSYLDERLGELEGDAMLFDYAGQHQAGLPIGSGPVEATAKTLVSVRMKRSGCRWRIEGAEAMLALRAAACSDQRWDPLMKTLIDEATAEIIPFPQGANDCSFEQARVA